MGFFTRNRGDDDVPAKRASRPAAAGDSARRRVSGKTREEVDELRRRARRRLVGAIAMVLVAVVVLPQLLDDEPAAPAAPLTVHMPQPALTQPNLAAVAPSAGDAGGIESAGRVGSSAAPAAVVDPRVPASIATITPVPGYSTPARTPPPAPQAVERAAPAQTQPQSQPPARPAPPPAPAVTEPRTPPNAAAAQKEAEAARALALLQGKPMPPAPSANTTSARAGAERFAVQVVAVRSREGADQLLSTLRGAGLTSYIETITTPEGQVYRVRLGPFNSRAQAESAQARLRGLPGGYSGSLVPL